MRRGPVSRHLVALVAAALLTTGLTTVLSAGSASAAAANPPVAPITGGAGIPAPSNLNGFNLATVGYEQSEYSLSGTANSYHDAGTHHAASTITNVAVASNVVTITTSAVHGIAVGDVVTITGLTHTALNRSQVTVTSVPSTTTFTFSLTTANVASVADSGTVTPNLTVDQGGKWTVAADATTQPYTTRAVVYRPIDPTKFNGTVIVEWLNVSGGLDANPDWTLSHNELIRDGFAWVGVSAQAIGVNQLKNCPIGGPPTLVCPGPGDPVRYASLSHPGDSYSYDIFSQAGQAVRDQSALILGGLTPNKIIAAGESQSASRLVTYIDAVHPLVDVYDGFLVHSRGATGSALAQTPLPAINTPNPSMIRNDLNVPVFVFETETDVFNSNTTDRQPDTNRFQLWEVAGSSHFDWYGLAIGPTDTGNGQGAVLNLAAMQHPSATIPGLPACGAPINTAGTHWVLNAAVYALNQWVVNGIAPPTGPYLQTTSTSPVVFDKVNGITLGGVRSPQVDAPIAGFGGIGVGPSFCFLFGTTVPYGPAQLAALYKNHGQFVSKWSNSAQTAVNGGFLLPPDQIELQNAAAQSKIGK